MVRTVEEQAVGLFGADGSQLENIAERFAEPRIVPVSLLAQIEGAQGHALGRELQRWVQLFERFEMEVADPAGAELRAPPMAQSLTALLGHRDSPAWLADLLGFLCAASVVIQQDEMSYLASWVADETGACPVHYFHPSDWGLWPTDRSIASRLYRLLQEDGIARGAELLSHDEALEVYEHLAQGRATPEHLDPARLVFRCGWLVHAWTGVGLDLERALRQAAPFAVYEREQALVAQWPHLAVYWMWSHYFLDNEEELKQCFEATQNEGPSARNGVVKESREVITKLLRGGRVKLGDRGSDLLRGFRSALALQAPATLFGPGAEKRRRRRAEDQGRRSSEEREVLKTLKEAAESEPLVEEALQILEHLRRGGALPPQPVSLHGGLSVEAAMDRLAELLDPRFRPLILIRMRRAALFGDTHQEASWGLFIAWATLADSFEGFQAAIERTGTQNLGPRRMTELYRAYGRFSERGATEALAKGAWRWLEEVDDWIRMTPPEPVLQLLQRDSLQTHEVIAALLQRASFTGANWEIALTAAIRAGELKAKRAVPGLHRAIEQDLGRLEDGSRAKVVQALFHADGSNSVLFLKRLVDAQLAKIELGDEVEVVVAQREIACLLAGLLPMAPDREPLHALAKELLEKFYAQLGLRRRVRTMAIAAAHAIISGVLLGQVRALSASVTPFAQLILQKRAPAKQAALELKMLANRVKREVG